MLMARWDLEWIVPIVVMLVYALSAILKAKDQGEAKPEQPARRNPGQELDRFLQEIDRLRRQQEARSPAPKNQGLEDEDEELAPPPPRPVVVFQEVRPAPLLPPPLVLRAETPPPKQQMDSAGGVARTPQVVKPSAAPMVTSFQRRGVNSANLAMNLLDNNRTLAAAFALNEILSPPKCKRRI